MFESLPPHQMFLNLATQEILLINMPKPTGPTNPILSGFIKELRTRGHTEKINFLIEMADRLSVPERIRPEVNLSKIERLAAEGETVLVPGKVLSSGDLTKKINVAALNFSVAAEEKILKSGGRAFTLKELAEKNPTGKNVKILV